MKKKILLLAKLSNRKKIMSTEIDISSLDEDTKNKIDEMSKRCSKLYNGVKRSTTLNVDYMVSWTAGTECDIVDIGPDIPGIPFRIYWDNMENLMDDLKQEIDEEIKEIIDFANSVADRLGVDRDEFFSQYFTT